MDVFKISVPNGIAVGTFDNTILQYNNCSESRSVESIDLPAGQDWALATGLHPQIFFSMAMSFIFCVFHGQKLMKIFKI